MRRFLVAATLMTVLAPAAGAQFASAFDLGGGVSRMPAGVWARDTRLATALRLDRGSATLLLDAEALERRGAVSLRRSALDGAMSTPLFGPARLALGGRIVASAELPYGPSVNLVGPLRNSALAAISLTHGFSGAWIGASVEDRMSGGTNVGVWRSIGDAVVTVSSTGRTDRASRIRVEQRTVFVWDSVWTDTTGWQRYSRASTVFDTSATTKRRRYAELEARLDWTVRRVHLTALVAGRTTQDSLRSAVWGRVNASIQLAPRLAVVAALGAAPTVPHTPSRLARFGVFGLRVSAIRAARPPLPAPVRPTATGFSVTPAGPGQYRVELRIPAARTVEVSGDFNGWKAVAARESSTGSWEVTLSLTSGTYRVNVRVDGATWTAPPGVPAIDDEFNGRVGLLVIP